VTVQRSRYRPILLAFAVLVALTTVAVVVGWRSITIEEVPSSDSPARFDQALLQIDAKTPLVTVDAAGHLSRLEPSRPREPPPTRLHVLAFDASRARLVSADVPLWFLKVKGPGAQYALSGTGLDLEKLGLTASDLEAAGAGVVIDERAANGNRLLAWTAER
jgi:hypothetical protein